MTAQGQSKWVGPEPPTVDHHAPEVPAALDEGRLVALRTDLGVAGRRAREATAERDRTICRAAIAGMPQRAIAREVGLSHSAVQDIIRRGTTTLG